MKVLYTIILVSFVAISGFAQTFSVETETQNATGYANDSDIYEAVSTSNNAGEVIVLSWERALVDIPEGWEISTCDPCTCYPIGVESGSGCYYSHTNPNGSLNTHFYPNGIVGAGQVKIRMWDESTLDEVIVTFNATANEPLVSVEEQTSSYIRTFPNPFAEGLNIEYNYVSQQSISVEVIDVLGKTVYSQENLPSSYSLSVGEDFNSGIYFCVVKSGNEIINRIKVRKI